MKASKVCCFIFISVFLLAFGLFGLFGFISSFPTNIFNEEDVCTVTNVIQGPRQFLIPLHNNICELQTKSGDEKLYYNKGYLMSNCENYKDRGNFTCYCQKDFCYDKKITLDKVSIFIAFVALCVMNFLFGILCLIYFCIEINIKNVVVKKKTKKGLNYNEMDEYESN